MIVSQSLLTAIQLHSASALPQKLKELYQIKYKQELLTHVFSHMPKFEEDCALCRTHSTEPFQYLATHRDKCIFTETSAISYENKLRFGIGIFNLYTGDMRAAFECSLQAQLFVIDNRTMKLLAVLKALTSLHANDAGYTIYTDSHLTLSRVEFLKSGKNTSKSDDITIILQVYKLRDQHQSKLKYVAVH
jgi:ribonuclease HI